LVKGEQPQRADHENVHDHVNVDVHVIVDVFGFSRGEARFAKPGP
jgi:hypothetical protein